MPRKHWVGGNWKCNGTVESITALCQAWNAGGAIHDNVDCVIAPTNLHIPLVKGLLRPEMQLAVQNVWSANKTGAFTGEITAPLVKNMGIPNVILGHSERRHTVAQESSELVAEKTVSCLENGLKVILCIGELLADRQANKTMAVCEEQLAPVIAKLKESQWSDIVIAYEPVWAIGTGVTASPEQAQEVHKHLREYMASHVSPAVAESVRIVYGGSVTPDNCKGLICQPDIDGFLVGGASLKPDFLTIVNA